jgi:type I restriction enzyme S subunit
VTLPPYPKYKPSGVQSLGDIPNHWEVKRLKNAAKYWVSSVDKVPAEDELPVRLCNYTDVYYRDQIHLGIQFMEGTATPEEIRRFALQTNDVLITKDSEEWGDIAIPAIVVETAPDLICGYHLAIIRPDASKITGQFLFRAFQASAVNQQFQVAATGVTRYGLPKSAIGEAFVPLPPVSEQTAITGFLDRQTAKIDTLVAKKRTLIERLKEERVALISRSVTRGLPPDAARAARYDPHPQLKSSGVDWLGEVPSTWTVTRIWLERVRGSLELQDGNHGELHPTADDYVPEGIPFVRANDIVRGQVDFGACKFIERQLAESLRIGFALEGDVLLTHKGTIGRVGIVQPNPYPYVMLTPQVTYYRAHTGIVNRFLFWAFQGAYWQDQMLLVAGFGSTRAYVGLLDQKRLTVILPPIADQIAIAEYLDAEVSKLDTLLAKVEAAVERSLEYRTALVTAAVTGRVDVRGDVE